MSATWVPPVTRGVLVIGLTSTKTPPSLGNLMRLETLLCGSATRLEQRRGRAQELLRAPTPGSSCVGERRNAEMFHPGGPGNPRGEKAGQKTPRRAESWRRIKGRDGEGRAAPKGTTKPASKAWERRARTWLPPHPPHRDGMEGWEQPQGHRSKGALPPAPRSDPSDAVQRATVGWAMVEHSSRQSWHPGAAQILAQKP